MVSISLEGGLGNNLFQISFLYAYAKKHELEYCIPKHVNNPHISGKGAYVFPGINYCDNIPLLPTYSEKHFHYEEIPKMDNVCFLGFFQSFKYFNEYRDELIAAFGFKWFMLEGVCSIHVRRSDYLKWPQHHPVVTEIYLENAMLFFCKKGIRKFLIVSDDMSWCREFFIDQKFENYHMDFYQGKNEIDDMTAASCCQFNIGSNSTFSLWIHYINRFKDKVGTFPDTWFGLSLPHDTTDLIPEEAIII